MLTFVLAVAVIYLVVRIAAQQGSLDAEQMRGDYARGEAFTAAVESGNLPPLTRPEDGSDS